jgi:hypothetical protein
MQTTFYKLFKRNKDFGIFIGLRIKINSPFRYEFNKFTYNSSLKMDKKLYIKFGSNLKNIKKRGF